MLLRHEKADSRYSKDDHSDRRSIQIQKTVVKERIRTAVVLTAYQILKLERQELGLRSRVELFVSQGIRSPSGGIIGRDQ